MLADVQLAQGLVAAGYENVAVVRQGGDRQLWYEDRLHLQPIEGLRQVLELGVEGLDASASVLVVPQASRLPLLAVRVPVAAWRAVQAGALEPAAFARILSFEPPPTAPPREGASLWRTDLALYPNYRYASTFTGFVEGFTNTLLTDGWQGHLAGRLYLAPEVSLGYQHTLVEGWHPLGDGLAATWLLGRWTDGAYGGNGEIAGWLDEGRWIWRVNGGYVGLFAPMLGTSAEYHLQPLELMVQVGAGWFGAGDATWFVRGVRAFPRAAVEGGLYRGTQGTQIRMGINYYLGADPNGPPGMIRVHPGYFNNQYRATQPLVALLPTPAASADRVWQRWSPAYVRAHLVKTP